MKHTTQNLLLWFNYILIILYMSRLSGSSTPLTVENTVPLLIASLMMIDMTYISACNIRENNVISLFCGLLALDAWYLLLLPETGTAARLAFLALSPVIWYTSVRFLLMFLFQGSGYRFRRPTNAIFFITCAATLTSTGISDRIYALLYGIQLLLGWICFLLIVFYHRKRATFVLKSEWKCILFSIVVIVAAFAIYCFATASVPYHLSNFGVYLPVLLFCMSVHGIVLREHHRVPLSSIFGRRQALLILSASLVVSGLGVLTAGGTLCGLCIAVNTLFSIIFLCNIVLEVNLKNGRSGILRQSRYLAALQQLQKEESLKKDFANFLHDDILQDILSVKNLLPKAHRPDIRDMVMETLDSLNTTIREQMQDYHPVILKNLTIRENYQNLMDAVAQSFPQRGITVSLDCPDTLFLVEPYNLLVYRLLKELLTNVYKHSDGNLARVTLALENNMITLCVTDDGNAGASRLTTADSAEHKGIFSITEQVTAMDGTIAISDLTPHGICVKIQIPMKGDGSYQYFVSR